MLTKALPVKIKKVGAADGLAEGEFLARVSVFGNIDSMGDVVMQGAFADDLEEWLAKGDPLPVVWSHDWRDPFSHLGVVLAAQEVHEGADGGGLDVHGRIEDLDSNAKAAQVYRLLKGRRVTQFSFAYDINEGGWGKRGEQEVYELRKLHVFEVGPTLVGANQETELLAAKAHQLAGHFAGAVDLAPPARKQLQQAADDLAAILALADGAKISDNPANPQREGVPDLDIEAGVVPGAGTGDILPADPPDGRTVDGSGIVHLAGDAPGDAKAGQEGSPEPAAEDDSAAKASELDPAQVDAWATSLLLTSTLEGP